jgi:hypothetical protein
MTMTNREHLLSLAVATALVAFQGAAKADDYSQPNTDQFARSEERAEPMTCAQARAYAWFVHELEISDGGPDNALAQPSECSSDFVATTGADATDPAAYEESK